MSTSAPYTPDIKYQKHTVVPEDTVVQGAGECGFGHWLTWLQSLLKAHCLTLYCVDAKNDQLQMKALASLPDVDSSVGSAYAKLALRCAKNGAVVRAVSETRENQSVVCLPDIVGSRKRVRHVLLIERQALTKLDMQTQIRLVSWAFKSLGRYSPDVAWPSLDSRLSQWALACIDRSGSLSSAFAQLMDQLVIVSGSDRCLIAQLRVRQQTVSGARLLGLSGQQHVDNRLAASDSLLIAIEKAYCDKTQPLSTDHQCMAEPSIAVQTPITTMLKPCARLIIPVAASGQCYAISLERSVDRPFTRSEQAGLERELGLTIALLILSDPHSRKVTAVARQQIHHTLRWMRDHVPRAMMITTLCLVGLLFLFLPAEHRVSAPLSVEASERHVLIAPMDGFVESVSAKAGDRVEKGQVLASLDDLDLQLQIQKRESEVRQNQQAYTKALASYDRVDVTRLKEQAAHLQTELSQLALRRERMILVAPVDGVVLSGSWDDFLGAAVSSGDALFTLGSINSHRLVLDVSEYDVKNVRLGQSVGIRMSADPSNVLSGTVTAIMPLAVVKDGANSVQVHAVLDHSASLRPGMEGLGKVLIGKKSKISQWLGRAGIRLVWLGWKLGVLK
ncbi:MAG: efflux RND transporter periplasmic adaptor subunit [Granulosicoccus sp.]